MTRQKVGELCPDLALSVSHLFLSTVHDFAGEEPEWNRLSLIFFFCQYRDKSFYERGMMTISSEWQKVIVGNGEYLTQIRSLNLIRKQIISSY